MPAFQIAMMVLGIIQSVAAQRGNKTTSTVADAIEDLTDLYNKLVDAAKQNAELTPEEESLLSQHANTVFTSVAANPDLNQ